MPKSNPIAYYGKKILVFLLSVLVLSIVVFYVARLAPGDPLVSYYGERTEKMSWPKELPTHFYLLSFYRNHN